MSKKIQRLKMSLYPGTNDAESGQYYIRRDDVELSFQNSESTIKAFRNGVAEVSKLARDPENKAVVPGQPFYICCVWDEYEESVEVEHTGRSITTPDGVVHTVGEAAAPTAEDDSEVNFA